MKCKIKKTEERISPTLITFAFRSDSGKAISQAHTVDPLVQATADYPPLRCGRKITRMFSQLPVKGWKKFAGRAASQKELGRGRLNGVRIRRWKEGGRKIDR